MVLVRSGRGGRGDDDVCSGGHGLQVGRDASESEESCEDFAAAAQAAKTTSTRVVLSSERMGA